VEIAGELGFSNGAARGERKERMDESIERDIG